MSDLSSMVDSAAIQALHIAERDEMLRGQIAGCLLSRAALHDLPNDKIKDRALAWASQITKDWERNPQRMAEKLAQARVKYGRVTE